MLFNMHNVAKSVIPEPKHCFTSEILTGETI